MADEYVKMLERLSLYRKSLAMIQSNVAEKLGVTQSRLSKGESGQESFSNDFLTALYQSGWDIDYIVTGLTGKKKRKTLREELIDFSEDDEIFRIIYWSMYHLCKNHPDFNVYRVELNLLNFMCHNQNTTVFEALRQVHGLSQTEYAEMLHMTTKKCRNLEKGVIYPSADLINQLYNLFGCRPTLLLKVDNVKWNILENVWNHIEHKEEKLLVNIINNVIIYYKQISDD